ncbi:flavin reductase family protein [Alkalibacterium sp. MB6]|uniref:flavin reductase family protein n=1 Tax=Alkalibacterium sp. MB6 TaxID=2081965 RepID=UPI00137A6F25|nr:flavin reductase family protein [Alkalibacterium sp. MB6]
MYHFSTDDLSLKQQYKFLTGSVIPRPIAWITSLNEDSDTVNAAPFSFFSVVSNQIPLLSVSILRTAGKQKDSAVNILKNKEAVIHIVSSSVIEEMNATSAPMPSDESELDRTDLSLVDSKSISVPGIKEALIRFETTLYQHVPVEDEKGEIITDLFLLKVTDYYFDESVFDKDKDYILPEQLDPVARLAGIEYASIGKVFSMIRPDK